MRTRISVREEGVSVQGTERHLGESLVRGLGDRVACGQQPALPESDQATASPA